MAELGEMYKAIPFFTRYWLSFTLGLSLLGRFGVFNYRYLILDYYGFITRFQIWRGLTSVFYYPIGPATGFHFLINCYFLYTYSKRLETGIFAGKPADYCYLLMFNWACCLIIGLLIKLSILMDPMVLSVLYVWCQLNKEVVVSFWFGTRFKAMYLPWVLFLFNLVINGGGVLELLGILVGHVSFFLMFQYPQEFGGPALLTPPAFLKQIFPDTRFVGGFGTAAHQPLAPQNPPGTMFGGHNWGRGRTLGGN